MLENVAGFDWDDGNAAKCQKHAVSREEVESLFARSFVVLPDPHAGSETRFRAIGKSGSGMFFSCSQFASGKARF